MGSGTPVAHKPARSRLRDRDAEQVQHGREKLRENGEYRGDDANVFHEPIPTFQQSR